MRQARKRKSPTKKFLEARQDYEEVIPQETFARLVQLEEEQFEYICRLEKDQPDDKNARGEAIREWWNVVNGILWMFTRTQMQQRTMLEPFPAFTFARLANIAEDLSNGHLLSIVEDVSTQDAGRRWYRAQREDIAYAVLYIEAVGRGEIMDRRARSNVSERYGVSPQTVRNWLQKERDRIVVGVPHRTWSPEQLTERMQAAGERYRIYGPGNG